MSEHAWVLENIAGYVAGGLEETERERLEHHVADCEPCAQELGEAREIDSRMDGLFARIRPSAALEDRLIRSLRTAPVRSAFRLPLPVWFGIGAAAAVLVAAVGAMASNLLADAELPFPGSNRIVVSN